MLPTHICKLLVCTLFCISVVYDNAFAEEKKDQASNHTLNIQLDNIRNNKGNLYIFIYKYENQYPFNPELHFEILKSNVSEGRLTYIVKNLSKGKYAITLLDDENANKDLDKFLGIPCEGFGFSNNVKPLFSLPEYQELLFDIKDNKTIHLTLQYFF